MLSRLLVVSWGLFFVSGCNWIAEMLQEEPLPPPVTAQNPEPESETAADVRSIKLIDERESLRIEQQLDAWVNEQREQTRQLLNWQPSAAALKRLGWQQRPGVRLGKRGKSQVLNILPAQLGERPLAIILPAQGNTYVEAQLLAASAAKGLQVTLIETAHQVINKKRLDHPKDLAVLLRPTKVAGSYLRVDAVLASHVLGNVSESAQHGQLMSAGGITHPATRSVILLIERRASGAPARTALPIMGLRVIERRLGAEERLALAQERYAVDDEWRGFGQFLPLAPRNNIPAGQEENFAFRRAFLLPTTTTLRWSLAVPNDGVFRADVGITRESPRGGQSTLRVMAGEQVLSETSLNANEPRRWLGVEADLKEYAGQNIDLKVVHEASGEAPVLASLSNAVVVSKAAKPANVFVFAVDTLRADRMGVYGHEQNNTPHIAEFVKDAVLFKNAVAQSNWTPESFAGIFTGDYVGVHRVTGKLSRLRSNTMAEKFSEHGYFSRALIYKLFMYDMGFERGFDDFFNVPRFDMSTAYAVKASDNWQLLENALRQHTGLQQFLFIHFNDPHQPFNQDNEYISPWADEALMQAKGLRLPMMIAGLSVVTEGRRNCADCVGRQGFAPWFVDLSRGLYDGEIAYTDKFFGEFVALLK